MIYKDFGYAMINVHRRVRIVEKLVKHKYN